MTCICSDVLTVKHILLVWPNQSYFRKMGMTIMPITNNVRDILCNTDVMTSIVKLIVRSPVGKLV